jgi:hypothetical protein
VRSSKNGVDITARIASMKSGAVVRIQRKTLPEAVGQIGICDEQSAKCYKVRIAFFEYGLSFRRIKAARCNDSAREEFAQACRGNGLETLLDLSKATNTGFDDV